MDNKAENPLEAQEYARLTGFDGKWRETWWRTDFLKLITERNSLSQIKSVLDVGCGAGHWGRSLSQVLPKDIRISGIDIEQNFVHRSKELGKAFGLLEMDYRIGFAESLPYSDNTFDLVTCQTVLIHVKDPRLVLREMKRVLKPDGVLLVAEPNNITGFLNGLLGEPRPEWIDVQRLLNFYHTCLQGKKNLGMGDSSVGERLPGMIAEVGLKHIRVAVNENCPALIPPYATEVEQVNYEFLKSCMKSDSWSFGPRQNTLRFFIAGEGSENQFEDLWQLAISSQREMLRTLENNSYSGGRSSLMYLISAKK